MDFKFAVQNEVIISGEGLVRFLMESVKEQGIMETVVLLKQSDVLIIKDEETTRITMLPDCKCESCTRIKGKVIDIMRAGASTEEVGVAINEMVEEEKIKHGIKIHTREN